MFALLLPLLLPWPVAAQEGHRQHGESSRVAPSNEEIAPWSLTWPLLEVSRRRGSGLQIVAHNFDPEGVAVYPSGGGMLRLPLLAGRAVFNNPGSGNYHWLMARDYDCHDRLVTINAAPYISGEGPAPTILLAAGRSELEVIPRPLPRERMLYRGGETWRFLLRFQGEPLVEAELKMETEYGSTAVFRSNAKGLVRVIFPDDIPEAARGGAGRRGPEGRFVLALEHEQADQVYLTTFSGTYRPHVFSDRSPWRGGIFLMLGGFAAGILVLRSRGRG